LVLVLVLFRGRFDFLVRDFESRAGDRKSAAAAASRPFRRFSRRPPFFLSDRGDLAGALAAPRPRARRVSRRTPMSVSMLPARASRRKTEARAA
jgi:hypothetical protein